MRRQTSLLGIFFLTLFLAGSTAAAPYDPSHDTSAFHPGWASMNPCIVAPEGCSPDQPEETPEPDPTPTPTPVPTPTPDGPITDVDNNNPNPQPPVANGNNNANPNADMDPSAFTTTGGCALAGVGSAGLFVEGLGLLVLGAVGIFVRRRRN